MTRQICLCVVFTLFAGRCSPGSSASAAMAVGEGVETAAADGRRGDCDGCARLPDLVGDGRGQDAGTEARADRGGTETPARGDLDAGGPGDLLHGGDADAADAALAESNGDGSETDGPDGGAWPSLAAKWPIGAVERVCGEGLLALADTPSGEVGFLVVRGDHYEMGMQAGCLVGDRVGQFFASFMSYFLAEVEAEAAEMGLDPDATSALLTSMLENLWQHMAPYVPQEYLDEMLGFHDAVMADPVLAAEWQNNTPEGGLKAMILLSNLSDLNWSGDAEDVLEKLSEGYSSGLAEYYGLAAVRVPTARELAELFGRVLPFRTSCSYFAAWGERTADQHMLGSRNLDWSTDTGIAVLKGISIYDPEDGNAYATIGYLGFMGALAGMSEKGIAVSEVGSESAMERLKGEPWTVKFREVLEKGDDLDTAVALATGTFPDGQARPTTIGYNWMIAFGDPPSGAAAGAAALETNGVVAGVHRGSFDCDASSELFLYDQDGLYSESMTDSTQPFIANLEGDAVEIDAQGNPRLFAADLEGNLFLDADGCPAAESVDGVMFEVGHPLSCALYRGDEALMHGVRRWQLAANGPQGGSGLMCHAGSYRHRYMVMHDLLHAFEVGSKYEKEGETWADGAGEKVFLGLAEAEKVARAAAMGSNVMSIAYDATALRIRVSWEIGSGDAWEAAHKHEYAEFDLKEIFALLEE